MFSQSRWLHATARPVRHRRAAPPAGPQRPAPTARHSRRRPRHSSPRPTICASTAASRRWSSTTLPGKYVGGTFSYQFEILTDSSARVDGTTLSSGAGGTTSWVYPTDLERDTPYRWRARARMGGSVGPWSATRRFITVLEKRASDPVSGKLPYPSWGGAIVAQVAAARPDLLRRSCQDEGGTWEFMDLVVDTLRLEDTRFGYNCKRGNCNDPSKDIVAYNYSAGPDEGNSSVYIIDTISGHCGPRPDVRRGSTRPQSRSIPAPSAALRAAVAGNGHETPRVIRSRTQPPAVRSRPASPVLTAPPPSWRE